MTCTGHYRIRLNFPATLGAECVGRVLEIGPGVATVKPGDLVINLLRDNWTQKRKVRGEDVIRLPEGIDLRQAAMVRINPTAHLMLTDHVDLTPRRCRAPRSRAADRTTARRRSRWGREYRGCGSCRARRAGQISRPSPADRRVAAARPRGSDR